MCRRYSLLVSLVLLMSIAAISSAADVIWTNGGLDGNWNNTANWSPAQIPNATSDQAKIKMTAGPVFSAGRSATAYRVFLGTGGTDGRMTIDGGSLTTNSYIILGEAAGDNSTLTINSGSLTTLGSSVGYFYCGKGGSATINMNGGTVTTAAALYVGFTSGGNGVINLSGGTVTVTTTLYVATLPGSNGLINLSGGSISCNSLSMRALGGTGTIDITSGTLIIDANALPTINPYVTSGWIKAYNGAGTVLVDYGVTNPGKTTVKASPPTKAGGPSPANNATNVSTLTNLSWIGMLSAVSHDVYFGTDFNDVNSVSRIISDLNGNGIVDWDDVSLLTEYWLADPTYSEPYVGVDDDDIVDFFDYALLSQDWMNSAGPVFKGNQDVDIYNPGRLAINTAYYWRIDEVNGPDTARGDVWSFATGDVVATNPSPANGATNLPTNTTLSWTAGVTASSHDVYFGTTNPPAFIRNQTATTYNPGTLAIETTYYWCIDEVEDANIYTGAVWSFSTAFKKGPYLIYPGDNTQMTVLWQSTTTTTCTLAWGLDPNCSTGSTVTSEYGTDHQHKYTITGLTPGTKYYYRITTGSGSGQSGSFRTAPAADATKAKFFAYGDTRTNPDRHSTVCAGIISAFTSDPDYQTMLLHIGDWVSGDQEVYWTEQFFNYSYPPLLQMPASLPMQGCMGNHEEIGVVYAKYWPYPYVAARYWSFDYGPAHIAVVDQYTDYSPGSAQYSWLVDDLSSSTKQWKFIVLHEPGWSAAGGHSNNTYVQTRIQPLCEAYGVQIVFGGHNHYYARAVVNGVHHITTGAGGAPFHTPKPDQPYVVTYTGNTLEFCKVDIDGDSLVFRAIKAADGTVIDSFFINKSGPDFTFVQATDPQIDMCVGSAIGNPVEWIRTISKVNNINPLPVFMVVTGDMLNSAGNESQFTVYEDTAASLDSNIARYEVAGNHDIDLPPTPSSYAWYESHFGSPWYSFNYGDCLFIVLESNILKDATQYPGKDTEQIDWLTSTLAGAGGYTQKIVFMHHSLALSSVSEPNDYSNMPTARRMQLLSIFHQYGVKAVFSGHLHQNRYVRDGELEIITTSSCTCPLGADPTGLRIIKVYSNHIEQEYRSLDSLALIIQTGDSTYAADMPAFAERALYLCEEYMKPLVVVEEARPWPFFLKPIKSFFFLNKPFFSTTSLHKSSNGISLKSIKT